MNESFFHKSNLGINRIEMNREGSGDQIRIIFYFE